MTGSREEGNPRSHDGDDLDALVVPGAATASHSEAHADDDVIDLGALTKLSTSARPSAAEPEPQSPTAVVNAPRLEELAPVHVPVPRHSSTAWLLPLLIGFLAGMPAGAWLLGGRSVTPPAAASAPMPSLPSTAAQAPSVGIAAPAEPAAAERPQGASTADAERERVKPLPSAEPSVPTALAVARAGASAPEPRRSAITSESSAAAELPQAQAASATPTTDSASQAPVLSLTKLDPADPVEAAFPEVKSGDAPSAAPKSMNDLLDDAIAGAPRPTAAPETQAFAAAEAPLAPSRQDVSDTMAVLVPAIRGCAMGQAGLATAGIVVQSDGKVASVKVTGAPFEGAASGRCMEGVLRRARFPRFRQSVFRVQFPFAIE